MEIAKTYYSWFSKILLFSLLLNLISIPLTAQNTTAIDSIQAFLKTEIHDTSRVKALADIAMHHMNYDEKQALKYSKQALELTNKIDYKYGIAISELRLGTSYLYSRMFDSADNSYNRLIEVAKNINRKDFLSSAYCNKGLINNYQGNSEKALELLQKSLDIEIELGNTEKLISRHNNIAAIYQFDSNLPKALEHYLKSLEVAKNLGIKPAEAQILNNIGKCYDEFDEKDKALKYYLKSLEIADSSYVRFASTIHINIGDIYVHKGEYQKAISYYYPISKNKEDDFYCSKTYAYIGLSLAYLGLENIDSAEYYVDKGFDLASACIHVNSLSNLYLNKAKLHLIKNEKTKAKNDLLKAIEANTGSPYYERTYDIYNLLSELYEEEGNYEEALKYHKVYTEIKDSLFNEKRTKKITQLQVEYDFKAKKVEQEKEKLILQQQLSNYRKSRIFFIIGLMLFIALAYILFIFYYKKKSANKILEEKNRTILNQQQELVTKANLIKDGSTKIKELSDFKNRLAHMAVHDMKNPLNTVMGLSQGKPTEKNMKLINQASNQMFNFITNMLDIYKFEEAEIVLSLNSYKVISLINEAENQVSQLLKEKDITLVKNVDENIKAVVDETIIVRVFVNLFTNAIKYSYAGNTIHVDVNANFNGKSNDKLEIKITDSGIGIPKDQLTQIFEEFNNKKPQLITKSASTGIGLNFCKLAISAHKGVIMAESDLGKGTSIIIQLPLSHDNCPKANKAQASKQEVNTPTLILEKERSLIKKYAQKLEKYKVHEVSKINNILKQMDEKNIQSGWKKRIQAAVYSGENSIYKNLIKKALEDGK